MYFPLIFNVVQNIKLRCLNSEETKYNLTYSVHV